MNLLPSVAIAAGLVAGLVLPLLLVLLSHGPCKVQAPGQRFVLAAVLTAIGWALFLATRRHVAVGDVAASAMLLLMAVLAEFTLWTLIAWGFTLSLLLRLAEAQRPLTFEEWVAAYTGGHDVERFAADRLGLLFRLDLARMDCSVVSITPGQGRRLARLVGLLRHLFGVHS